MTEALIRVCCCCRRYITPGGEAGDPVPETLVEERVTHGYCNACLSTELGKISELEVDRWQETKTRGERWA